MKTGLTFTSYPAGKRHAVKGWRAIPGTQALGNGTEFVAPCGTRAVLWEHVFYQDRLNTEPANCLSCQQRKSTKEMD